MFKDKLRLRIRGRATFQFIDADGRIIREIRKNNTIQPDALDITSKNLIAYPPAIINQISLYLAGNLIFAKPISSSIVVQAQQVQFQAQFAITDFAGSFDEAKLTATGMGDFSIITGLVGSKSNAEALLVTWNITIS